MKTIGDMIHLYLHGSAELGWPGKLHLHERDANGHSEGENHRFALKHLAALTVPIPDEHPAAARRTLFGNHLTVADLRPDEIAPPVLRRYQERLIKLGRKRSTINRNVGRLLGSDKRRGDSFFEWLVQVGACQVQTLMGLRCVGNIRRGRPGVKESKRILAVPAADLAATLRCVDKQLEEMMRVQYFCDMRPGELLGMRPCDIQWTEDRELLVYHPAKHKTLWRGQTRRIYVGAEAHRLIGENCQRLWGAVTLFGDADLPKIGDPQDQRYIWADAERPGAPRFTRVQSYTKAIQRGAARAKVPAFGANQIRKRSTTDAGRRAGKEVAAQVAGHSDVRTTEKHYIDPDDSDARGYIEQWG